MSTVAAVVAAELDRGDALPPTAAKPDALPPADDKDLKVVAELAASEEEDKEEDEEEDETGKKKSTPRIPLARHKAMLEAGRLERDVLEAKLAQYERGNDFAATNDALNKAEADLIELEGHYSTEIVDGVTADANKTMGEIRRLEKAISQQRIALAADAAESRAYERARYDTIVERIEAAYPSMNPDLPDVFDTVQVAKVQRMAKAYQMDGMTPGKALQEAVKDILGEPETAKQEVAVTVQPKVSAADAAAAQRKEAAVKKALDAAGKTPSSTGKAGLNSDALGGSLSNVDVMKLDQDAFAKLDEGTLAKLRGDEL